MRWFSDNEIVVVPSPEEFVFRGSADEVRLAPVLWLDAEGKRVHAAGDAAVEGDLLKRVEVFRPQPTDPDVSRLRLLTMLLRYGLTEIIRKSVFMTKPSVRFGSLIPFDSILAGFQRDIFERAAVDAGARQVRFDPDPVR